MVHVRNFSHYTRNVFIPSTEMYSYKLLYIIKVCYTYYIPLILLQRVMYIESVYRCVINMWRMHYICEVNEVLTMSACSGHILGFVNFCNHEL